jgi:hypothetical protein
MFGCIEVLCDDMVITFPHVPGLLLRFDTNREKSWFQARFTCHTPVISVMPLIACLPRVIFCFAWQANAVRTVHRAQAACRDHAARPVFQVRAALQVYVALQDQRDCRVCGDDLVSRVSPVPRAGTVSVDGAALQQCGRLRDISAQVRAYATKFPAKAYCLHTYL